MTQLHRIYFDMNDGDSTGRYDLGITGSLEDIKLIEKELRVGMRVVIYMTGELEMEAILERDDTHKRWMARPIEGTEKYLDGSNPN